MMSSTEACLEQVVGQQGRACIIYEYFLSKEIGTYYTASGEPLLKVFLARDYEVVMKFGFPKGGIPNKAMNDLLVRLIESGLSDMWYDQEKHRDFMLLFLNNPHQDVESTSDPD